MRRAMIDTGNGYRRQGLEFSSPQYVVLWLHQTHNNERRTREPLRGPPNVIGRNLPG